MRKHTTLAVVALLTTLVASSVQAQRGRTTNASDITGSFNRVINVVSSENAPATAGAATVMTSVAPLVQNVSRSATLESLTAVAGAPRASLVSEFLSQFNAVVAQPNARRIATASSAFNAMVNDASASYLANPPVEFVSAATVLQKLVDATSR